MSIFYLLLGQAAIIMGVAALVVCLAELNPLGIALSLGMLGTGMISVKMAANAE